MKNTKQKLEFSADTKCHTDLRAESSNYKLQGRADQNGWRLTIKEKLARDDSVYLSSMVLYVPMEFDSVAKIDELIEMLQKAKEHVVTFENTWKNGN